MIASTLKTQKELKIDTISYAMFEEATDCIIIRKGETTFYSWYQIFKEPYQYLFREVHKTHFDYIKYELELYREMKADPPKYAQLSKFLPKYIKVATKKNMGESIEILQEYSGFPLSVFSQRFEEAEMENKIDMIQLLLSECCKSLKEAEIIHGELISANILYDIEYGNVSFLSGNSIILKSDLGSKPFRPHVVHPIYRLFYSSNIKDSLDPNSAYNADLSAIALSIYECGFEDPKIKVSDLINDSVSREINIKNILSKPHILQRMTNAEARVKLMTNFEKLMRGDGTSVLDSLASAENIGMAKLFRTLKYDAFVAQNPIPPHVIVKELITSDLAKNIHLVLDKVPYIIKKAETRFIAVEKNILDYLDKISADGFVKLMPNLKSFVDEIAIEYKGVDISNKLKFISKEVILNHIPNILAKVCNNLYKANIFHADIKPSNVCFDVNWIPYLFDYDISQIIPNIQHITDDQVIDYPGISADYASPEIALCYLKAMPIHTKVKINPFKSDLYSLARSLVAGLHKKTTIASLIKSFYNKSGKFNDATDANANSLIKANVKNEGGKFLLKDDMARYTALFFWENSAQFAEEVKTHKDVHLSGHPNYSRIMDFLSKCLNPEPTLRPSLADINSELKKLSENIILNERFFSKQQATQEEKDWNIECFSQRFVKPKLEAIKSLVIPFVNMDENTQFYNYSFVREVKTLTLFKNDALIFSAKTPPLCKFIQLLNYDGTIDLYVTGGIDEYLIEVPTHYLVDIKAMQLVKKESMYCSRKEFGLTTFKNTIIVAGGSGNYVDPKNPEETTVSLNTIEKYDTVISKWEKLTNLQTGRINPCLVHHSTNILYVIGGIHPCRLKEEIKENNIICKTVESYDMNTGAYLKEIAFKTEIYCPISDIIFLEKGESNELLFVRNFTLIPPEKREEVTDIIDIINHEVYSLNLKTFEIKKEITNSDDSVSYFNSYNVLKTEECSLIIPRYIYKEENMDNKTVQIFDNKTYKITAIMSQ